MSIVMGIVGILVTMALAWIASSDRKRAFSHWINILMLLGLQLVFAFLLLSTTVGETIISWLADGFNVLLGFAQEGISFVFGDLVNVAPEGGTIFFFGVLMPIIFVSAIIGILQFLRILPLIIKGIGWFLSKVTGMPYIESYNGAASMFLGQSEVFITLKHIVPQLNARRLYTLCAQAMSSVSLSIVGAYMAQLEPRFVIVAIIMNLFGIYVVSHIINPYPEAGTASEEETDVEISNNPEAGKSFFQVLGDYIMDGARVAVIVGAMLIGYIALIALLNNLFLLIPGNSLTFQDILGYVFMPLAFLMGIPWAEAHAAASIMATKLITNEFVAIFDFIAVADTLSEKTQGMISVFLISFANFSSIGIIAGSVKGIHEESGNTVARFGLKLVYGASLVSMLSAVMVGFFL